MNDEDKSMPDPYAVFARFYDYEFGEVADDLDLYRQFAREAGGPILELGCGTGRVLKALLDSGSRLTGVDNSPAMLDIARRRVGDRATLVVGDFEDVSELPLPDAPYWMAFFALNTFLHVPDAASQLATLRALREVVVSGGLLLLDLFSPDPQYLVDLDGRVTNESSGTLPDGEHLDKWVSRTHDAASQTIDTRVWFDVICAESAQMKRYSDSYRTRYVYRFELEHLLARAGWEIVSVFGSYDLEPYGPAAERMIVLATWGTDLLTRKD